DRRPYGRWPTLPTTVRAGRAQASCWRMDVSNTEKQTRLPNYRPRRKISGPVIPRIRSVAKNLVLEFEPLVGYSLLPFCVPSNLSWIAYYRLAESVALSLAF